MKGSANVKFSYSPGQGCISCVTCSYPELTEDHVLTSAYVRIFRIVTRNAVNKSFWRKKDCSWPPLNKYAMNIWLSSLRIRAHLSSRTGKHLHVLHVLRTYSTCSYPGYQDTTTYAALGRSRWEDDVVFFLNALYFIVFALYLFCINFTLYYSSFQVSAGGRPEEVGPKRNKHFWSHTRGDTSNYSFSVCYFVWF